MRGTVPIAVLLGAMVGACGGGGDGGTPGPGTPTPPAPAPPPPFCLTVGVPVAARVDKNASNSCSVSVTAGASYAISITGLTDNANLTVTASGVTQCATSSAGQTPENCIVSATSTALEVAVDGNQVSGAAADYIITVALAPVVTLPIAAGTNGSISRGTPTLGLVAPRSESSYLASGLTAGTHTVSITGLTDDADLRVFSDSTYSMELNCTLNRPADTTNQPEDCTLSTGTDLYFSVRSGELNRDGAGYVILVW